MTGLRTMSLPQYLEGDGAINSLEVTGLLVGEVTPPKEFQDIGLLNPSSDVFVQVDLIGVNLDGIHYYARGRILTVIPQSAYASLRATNKPRNLVLLRGGSVRMQRGSTLGTDFVVMAAWKRGAYNAWKLSAIALRNPGRNAFPEFLEVAMTSARNNWEVTYPTGVPNNYRYATPDYQFQYVNPFGTPQSSAASPETASASAGVAPSAWGSSEGYAELPAHQTPGKPISESMFTPPPSSLGGSSEGVNPKQQLAQNMHENLSAQRSKEAKPSASNRFTLAPRPETVEYVEGVLSSSEDKVKGIMEEMRKLSFGDDENEEAAESDSENTTSESENVEEEVEDTEEEILDTDLPTHHMGRLSHTKKALAESWQKSTGYVTGRALFKEAMESVLEDFTIPSEQGISPIDEYLTAMSTTLLEYWFNNGSDLGESRVEAEKDKFLTALFENRLRVYFRMIGLLLTIRYDLTDSYEACEAARLDFFAILDKNPYYLCFIDPRLKIEELDKLASFSGLNIFDPEIMRLRNVAYMHNLMLDQSTYFVRDNTIVEYDKAIRGAQSGFILNKNHYTTLEMEGYYIKRDRLVSLHFYINPNLKSERFRLPTSGWRQINKNSGKMLLPLQGVNSLSMVKDYIDSGLGLRFEINNRIYLSDYIFTRKELYIYNRLRELCTYKPKTLRDEDIADVIKSFESMKHKELGLPADVPYKLEERQADAVRILGSGNRVMCLTGPAGSGKTTTAEAVVYGIETLLDKTSNSIYFCGPTGKAANRLKEVVKRKTSTINSLYKVGGDNIQLTDPDDVLNLAPDGIEVLVMDESSMPNINLMYEVVLRIKNGTYVFFLGDKEQLTPIGFGKPFATMLTYLPTVVLNVTKRASDKSGITRNCTSIINESDDSVVKDLVDTADFRILDTKSDTESVAFVKAIVDYHLYGKSSDRFVPVKNADKEGNDSLAPRMSPDDIQVITPINVKPWGTINLNRILQDSFNPRDPKQQAVFFPRGENDTVQFRLNDRVMHINTNDRDKARLIRNSDGSFDVWVDNNDRPYKGIANGEVGKVMYFIPGKELQINYGAIKQEEQDKFKRRYTNTATALYVAVRFSDIDVETSEMVDFFVLYKCELTYEQGNDLYVSSYELRNLDLCYAATVHKMQGSQAKLCICLFHEIGGSFITRNMVYTSASRAREGCYMLGSIRGSGSVINKARRIEQSSVRQSLVDVF